jgi:antitoxin HigA-1
MRPIHPGEILREEFLVPLELSAHALAMALKVPAPRINDIVRERRAITPDTALRLAHYFILEQPLSSGSTCRPVMI